MHRIARLTALISLPVFLQNCMTTSQESAETASNHGQSGMKAVRPAIRGVTKSGYVNGEKIEYLEVDGQAYWDGDILLSKDQILSTPPLAKASGAGSSNPAKRWPNNLVYYSVNGATPDPTRITRAISHWEFRTQLRFIPWINQTGHPNYVEFQNGQNEWECGSTSVGMAGGKQAVRIGSVCSDADVIHELGHVVGLFHEHNRADRDNYITINWSNLTDHFIIDNTSQFMKYPAGTGFDHGSLDFNSIMIYSSFNAFGIHQDQPTMTKLDGSTWIEGSSLSTGDKAIVNAMYPSIFTAVPGLVASQVGVGPNGTAWMISTESVSGGKKVYRWNGSGWTYKNAGGLRITVNSVGNACIVTDAGKMRCWNTVAWVDIPSSKKWTDMAIGADNTLYAISNEAVNGGYLLYRYVDGNWVNLPAGATRVAVDPQGTPWVVNSYNTIFRYNGSAWVSLPGKATDLAIGPEGSIYILEPTAPTTGAVSVWTGSAWKQVTRSPGVIASGNSIDVGPGGNPWIVDVNGVIYN